MLLTKKAAEGVLEGMDSMLNDRDMGMVERMAMSLAEMTDDNDLLQVDRNVSCKISFILSLLVRILLPFYMSTIQKKLHSYILTFFGSYFAEKPD